MSKAGDADLVIGVDTHLDTHTAAFCDGRGRAMTQLQVPATAAGYQHGYQHARRAVVVLTLLLGFDLGLNVARNDLVSATGLVLVDQCRALTVAAHTCHEIFASRAPGSGKGVPGVTKVVEVHAFRADRPDGVQPSGHPAEVVPTQRTAGRPAED